MGQTFLIPPMNWNALCRSLQYTMEWNGTTFCTLLLKFGAAFKKNIYFWLVKIISELWESPGQVQENTLEWIIVVD